jgi:hypothetical protein
VIKKFEWVKIILKNIGKNYTPSQLALHSDEMHMNEKVVQWQNDSLLMKHYDLRTK